MAAEPQNAEPLRPGARPSSRRRKLRPSPAPTRLAVEVAVWGENTFFSGFDGTLAAGGLFVASLETLPVGHGLDLEIQLEGHTLRCRGRVVFQRSDSLANPACSPGAGFVLTGLGAEDERVIAAFLQKRAPMFWVAPTQG
jgi:hypothetical protein